MEAHSQSVLIMEEERRRFARDLHDGPVQVLSNTSMRLDVLMRIIEMEPALAEDEIRRIHRRLVQAVVDIRQLIYDLQPVAIDEMGLVPALVAMSRRLEKDWGIPITAYQEDEGGELKRLSAAAEIMLYRAAQEAAINAAKHAEGTQIAIRVLAQQGRVLLEVSDNGKGFDVGLHRAGHYGLGNMKARMELVDGTCAIHSSPDGGTTVSLTVPLSDA